MNNTALNSKKEEGKILSIHDIKKIITALVSVSDLGRGGASKIITEVEENNSHFIVIKNNKPKAVIVPVEDYIQYNEVIEDMELLSIAESRIKEFDAAKLISHKEVLNQSGLTEEDLEGVEVEIE